MDENQSKRRAKQALMFKLKGISNNSGIRPESSHMMMQQPQPQIQPQLQTQMPMKIDTQEDFRKMPYEGKAKYDNQLKALNALKNETEQRSQRPKKMFFQHYDTEEPYCPIIQNNSNPSGRPPNIPPEMYEGITVKPKRPWVYLGTENLPPVEYQQINQSSFKQLARKNIDPNIKGEGNRRPAPPGNTNNQSKPRKKAPAGKKQQGNESQLSQLDMSDQIPDEGESIFASQYGPDTINKQSENNKKSRMSSMKNSQSFLGQEYSMSEGTETRNKHAEIFGSDDDEGSDEQQNSEMFSRGKVKNNMSKASKKKMEDDYSDDGE